jgi:hypothetical protein
MDNTVYTYDVSNNELIQYTYGTLMAFVDAVIPRTPELARQYGEIMYYGALDFYTDEYLVMMLNYYTIPLSSIVAELLNLAAYEYIRAEGMNEVNNVIQEGILFAALSPEDRLLAYYRLSQDVKFSADVLNMQEYPGLNYVIASLIRFTMLGYYSEWFGYGTTRMDNPNRRMLEFYPLSWEQTGYPGPSFSYISYVNQYDAIRNNRNGETI